MKQIKSMVLIKLKKLTVAAVAVRAAVPSGGGRMPMQVGQRMRIAGLKAKKEEQSAERRGEEEWA